MSVKREDEVSSGVCRPGQQLHALEMTTLFLGSAQNSRQPSYLAKYFWQNINANEGVKRKRFVSSDHGSTHKCKRVPGCNVLNQSYVACKVV